MAPSFDSAPPDVKLKWFKRAREHAGQLGRQLDHGWRRQAKEGRRVRQLLHLLLGDFGQLGTTVPNIDVPESREGVDVALAFRIPKVDALTMGEDERTILLQLAQV